MFVGGRRLGAAAILAGLLAGTTGCSGSSSEPQTLPPISSTPAASTATPTTPTDKQQLAAATAVVREYFRLINNLSHDMNADAFDAIVSNDCPCKAFVKDVRQTEAKDQTYFGHIRIRSLTPAQDSATLVEVLASYDSSPGGTRDADGHVLYRGPARRGVTEMFFVLKTSSGWVIDRINIVRKGRSL